MTHIRKIIHIDMDAFFASVEQLDEPLYRGKPLIVGGSRQRGVVAAASYEARSFGIHSAMPSITAFRKCPHLIAVSPRFDRYSEVSNQIREIFRRHTDLIEPLSLDEAYLDVSENKQGIKSAMKIAMIIREDIKNELKLTASAGISFNKFLAKMASDIDKPDGLAVILPEQARQFIADLAIEDFHGIGKKTAAKMKMEGIHNGSDLQKMSKLELIRQYGKMGRHFYHIAQADDQRMVQANRIRKSIGVESTFKNNLILEEDLVEQLKFLHESLVERVHSTGRKGRTITVKLKFHDFKQQTRSISLDEYTDDEQELWKNSLELLKSDWPSQALRLMGISLSNLDLKREAKTGQLSLIF